MTRYVTTLKFLIFFILVFILSACSGKGNRDAAPRNVNIDFNSITNAVPKNEPLSRYGNPKSYSVFGKTYYTLKSSQGFKERGDASWYGTKFHGKRTSSGETYDMYAMTAAHKTLPLPSYVRVKNRDNGKEIVVKVNDRGPFHAGRIIDLSYVAALKLDIVKQGTGRVEIETIDMASNRQRQSEQVFIQVGAFMDKQNAQKVHDKLAQASIDSDIHTVVVNARKHIYRVRIGPFEQRTEAGNLVKEIENLGVGEAKVFSGNGE